MNLPFGSSVLCSPSFKTILAICWLYESLVVGLTGLLIIRFQWSTRKYSSWHLGAFLPVEIPTWDRLIMRNEVVYSNFFLLKSRGFSACWITCVMGVFCLFLVGPQGGLTITWRKQRKGVWFTEQVLLIRSRTGNFQLAEVSLQREKSGIIQNSGSKSSQIISNPIISFIKHKFWPLLRT